MNDRLTDDPHIDASDIEVTVQNGEVTLSGNVNERFAKRHAEDIAESVSGVTHVQNNIRVKRQDTSGTMGSGYGSNTSANTSIYGSNAGSSGSMTSGSAATGGTASATGTGADATGASSTGSSGANLASGGSSRRTGRTA